jgi:o-succinylbenzoate synthase
LSLVFSHWSSLLVTPLQTAWGPVTEREGWWVHLLDSEGRAGVGEVAPLPGFSRERPEEARQAVEAVDPSGLDPAFPVESVEGLDLPASVAHGVEQALWDLLGQERGRTACGLLGGEEAPSLPISRLVRDARSAMSAVEAGIGCLKLKVGAATLEEDLEKVSTVRRAVGGEVAMRLDANGAWSLAQAREALAAFAPLDIEMVEQPLATAAPPGDWSLLRGAGIPLAADESLAVALELDALLQAVDVVVLKPMVLGGLLASVHLGRRAMAAGCKVVVTSLLESGVGRHGALHVAGALAGEKLLACGLDTGGLLQRDPCGGPAVVAGVMRVSGPGFGVPR